MLFKGPVDRTFGPFSRHPRATIDARSYAGLRSPVIILQGGAPRVLGCVCHMGTFEPGTFA